MEEIGTRDSAFTKKKGRFQYSPPTARKAAGVTFDGRRDNDGPVSARQQQRQRDADPEKPANPNIVPKLSEDRVDKSVHWKDVYGIKIDEIAVLDKAVRARRFKPGEDIVDRVAYTLTTCTNEQNFSTRDLAIHLYKGGIKSIWLRGRGRGDDRYFYGTEKDYIDVMKTVVSRPSIDEKTVDISTIFEQLPDNDRPNPREEAEK